MSAGQDPVDAGHFTTMQVRGGRVQGRDRHLARLVTASRSIHGSGPREAVILKRIRTALHTAGSSARDCTLRVRIHPPGTGYRGDHLPPGDHDPALRIEVDLEVPRQPPDSPLRVRTHGGVRALPGIKHLALDFQLQLRDDARAAGFDDALLLTPDGRISEGTFWNVIFRDGDALVWPDAPALPGITRELLRAGLDRAGIGHRHQAVTMRSLGSLRAAFALNSTGIADIAAIDGHVFPGDVQAGATLRQLLSAVPWDPL